MVMYKRLMYRHYCLLVLCKNNYWIGLRKSFAKDAWEVNILGLMLIIHDELWWVLKGKYKKWKNR